MSSEPMELAKNWDPEKWQKVLPAYAQIKYDGVPLTFIRQGGEILALTRQNEQMTSVPHMLRWAKFLLLHEGASFTAECLLIGSPFKDSSGAVRRAEPNETIFGFIFDANLQARPKDTYFTRINQMQVAADALKYDAGELPFPFKVAPRILIEKLEQVDKLWDMISSRAPDTEGMMLHSLQKPFQPGKRCWGMSRYKPQPTIDLEVVSFEEAVSEAGEPLGMLGRVNVRLTRVFPSTEPAAAPWHDLGIRRDGKRYSEMVVGVGPGKLSHEERKLYWHRSSAGRDERIRYYNGDQLFAEIKYMPDPSYEALRQPTIQRFRTDKTEGDILEYTSSAV